MTSSLRSGLRFASHNKRLTFILYLLNLIFGLIVAIPFRSALQNFAGNSLYGTELASRANIDLLSEFASKNGAFFNALGGLMLVAGAVYWLFNLFASGGVFAAVLSPDDQTRYQFLANTGRYAARFFRLALWSIPVFGVFFAIQFLEPLAVRLIWGKDPFQNITWWGGWIRIAIGYLGILLYLITFDYARIHTVVTGEIRMRRSLWYGIRFTFRHFFSAFGIAFTPFLAGILFVILYNPVADALHAPNALIIAALFLFQQIYMVVRMATRLTLYASQARYYSAVNASHRSEPSDSIDSVVIQQVSS